MPPYKDADLPVLGSLLLLCCSWNLGNKLVAAVRNVAQLTNATRFALYNMPDFHFIIANDAEVIVPAVMYSLDLQVSCTVLCWLPCMRARGRVCSSWARPAAQQHRAALSCCCSSR